jgi:hypothetical protein
MKLEKQQDRKVKTTEKETRLESDEARKVMWLGKENKKETGWESD